MNVREIGSFEINNIFKTRIRWDGVVYTSVPSGKMRAEIFIQFQPQQLNGDLSLGQKFDLLTRLLDESQIDADILSK